MNNTLIENDIKMERLQIVSTLGLSGKNFKFNFQNFTETLQHFILKSSTSLVAKRSYDINCFSFHKVLDQRKFEGKLIFHHEV